MAIIYRTTTGTLTSNSSRKATYSAWVKRGQLSANNNLWSWHENSGNYRLFLKFDGNNKLSLEDSEAGSTQIQITTKRTFTDTTSWFHIYLAINTEENSSADRCKFYINGVRIEQGDFATNTRPSQNTNLNMNKATVNCRIAGDENGGSKFIGNLADVYWVDGSVIAVTEFGQVDAITGEWKNVDSPTIGSIGVNGYNLKFNNASNIRLDSSANNFTFTQIAPNILQTPDNPNNNFVTLNPLDTPHALPADFLYANTSVKGQSNEGGKYMTSLSMGMMGAGKFYFECQLNTNNQGRLGMTNLDVEQNPSYHNRENESCGRYDYDYGYDFTNGQVYRNTSGSAYGGASWSTNDFCSFAIDNTNKKMYIAKNGGAWLNSANPSSGTGGIDYSSIGDNNMFIITDNNSAGWNHFTFNFGTGNFETSTLSTSYSPTVGDTTAKFKYNIIPTGFTALSTKGLNL